jgi:hypothetical protein
MAMFMNIFMKLLHFKVKESPLPDIAKPGTAFQFPITLSGYPGHFVIFHEKSS